MSMGPTRKRWPLKSVGGLKSVAAEVGGAPDVGGPKNVGVGGPEVDGRLARMSVGAEVGGHPRMWVGPLKSEATPDCRWGT